MADYFVEGGDVLKNKLNISDKNELREAEEFYFSQAASDIITENKSPEKFNFEYLKYLHKRLFGEVYDFAGEIRTVNITKMDSSIPFCYTDFIETEADRIFSDLENKNYLKNMDVNNLCLELSELVTELNALHPFREGNGRTIRLFIQLLAQNVGFLVDYENVPHDEIIEADKMAFLGDNKKVQELYRKIVIKIQKFPVPLTVPRQIPHTSRVQI